MIKKDFFCKNFKIINLTIKFAARIDSLKPYLSKNAMVKLRDFILGVSLTAGILSLSGSETPNYIFYFIGDGMGMGHVLATQTYNRMILGNEDPLLMMQFPSSGVITTYSSSSPVTDSAAAGTALATG